MEDLPTYSDEDDEWLNDIFKTLNDETYISDQSYLPPKGTEDMHYVASTAVETPDDDPFMAIKEEPPDAHLRAAYRMHIRSYQLERNRAPTKAEKKDAEKLDWSTEEANWVKDEQGGWIPNDPSLKLDDDPIEIYSRVAALDDIQMNITAAPSPMPTTNPTDKFVIEMEQSDTGANASITPHIELLTDVRWFDPVTIGNAQKDSNLSVQAIGKFKISTSTGPREINMYYAPNASNTIISPTAICKHRGLIGFHQWSNCETNEGLLNFVSQDGEDDFLISICGTNGLWYHASTPPKVNVVSVQVNALSTAAMWELWHQRLAHCGRWAMENAHKHVIGVPKLQGNSFYKCPSCMAGKLCTKKSNSKHNRNLGSVVTSNPDSIKGQPSPDLRDTTITEDEALNDYLDELHLPDANPGQHFHLDFGFVRGSDYREKDDTTGKTFTSIDNKNSYLLIVDRKTRYMWTYNSASKEPPLLAIRTILSKFGSKDAHRTVRTDQDKGLGRSKDFLKLLQDLNFTPELTGTDNSQQNSRAERPHKDLGQMMRCLLHSSNLGPEYWTYALTMAVYIKNRIPHKSINKTPYEAFTGHKPDLSRMRIFGSRIRAKKPGRRPAKLDSHSESGIFLGFGATPSNGYYIDDKTGQVKLGTHLIFDEAHMSVPARKAPLAAESLQRLGYYNREQWIDDVVRDQHQADSTNRIAIQRRTNTALLPTRGTPDSIGLDLHSDAPEFTLQPGETRTISTGISATAPPGTYLRIAPRSGLTVKKHLHTLAGVIDPDYTGDIGVVLHNFGTKPQTIKQRDRIAQLIAEKASKPTVMETTTLNSTARGDKGFGSTDKIPRPQVKIPPIPINAAPTAAAAASVYFMRTCEVLSDITQTNSHDVSTKIHNISTDMNLTFDMPFDIDLSSSPFDTFTDREVQIKGDHPTLGLQLEYNELHNLPQLKHCQRSTPSARLNAWRRDLRDGFINRINETNVHSIDDVQQAIKQCRERGDKTLKLHFAIIDTIAIHTEKGLPQLFFDQLNVVSKHLFELRTDPAYNESFAKIIGLDRLNDDELTEENKQILEELHDLIAHNIDSTELTKRRTKLSRRKLKECSDWDDWFKSEHKQLDQYHAQNTFGPPQDLPKGANVLNLLWTYLIKDDGRKKARCVCNGSKHMRGSVTLAETYAAALEQNGSRLFWAAVALNNFICIGADASNAFAEAPPPKAPLYVHIDPPYREWYRTKFPTRPEIPKGQVMRVQGALQGHPESARLWAILIDNVIKELKLRPCIHEPNLYYTNNYNNTGKTVLFLRQVDDFAIACEDKSTATDVIESINNKMTIDVKELGMIDRFNGVDVLQSRHYIKLYNATYIRKILQHHHWLAKEYPLSKAKPIPMKDNTEYHRKLESAVPLTTQERELLEKRIGFTYRQAIGELIYALVTCRPDLSFAVVKLAQYSANPAEIHFDAVKQVYKYLQATIDRGLIYWRKTPNMSLPIHPLPRQEDDVNYEPSNTRIQDNGETLIGAVDSDYAGDNSHRKSVTGIVIKLAGGTVLYKTQYQSTIALSTTEAEFTAACEAGKYLLYVRSIMEEIGLEQTDATVLYEDNQGALLMATASRPTKRTRHMDVKHFVIQQWIANDLLNMQRINTNDNCADVLTKATGRTLFYRHMDYIQGYIRPEYVAAAA